MHIAYCAAVDAVDLWVKKNGQMNYKHCFMSVYKFQLMELRRLRTVTMEKLPEGVVVAAAAQKTCPRLWAECSGFSRSHGQAVEEAAPGRGVGCLRGLEIEEGVRGEARNQQENSEPAYSGSHFKAPQQKVNRTRRIFILLQRGGGSASTKRRRTARHSITTSTQALVFRLRVLRTGHCVSCPIPGNCRE